jgi:hypothetical protein
VPLFGAGGNGYYCDPAEPKRVYFDYAYTILTHQVAGGQYVDANGTSRWNDFSAQAYALLVLQRSVGGGCVDSDGDGVCDSVDNCPAVPNPGQEGTPDGDARGGACEPRPRAHVATRMVTPTIDQTDLSLISRKPRGQRAGGPSDLARRQQVTARSTPADVKACIPQCTRANCAIQITFSASPRPRRGASRI